MGIAIMGICGLVVHITTSLPVFQGCPGQGDVRSNLLRRRDCKNVEKVAAAMRHENTPEARAKA